MSENDDTPDADALERVRETVEGVVDETEEVSQAAREEISDALDELEEHVEQLRDRE